MFSAQSGDVVRTVNGDVITQQDIDNRANFVTAMGGPVSDDYVVEDLVTETILLQEADRRRITLNEEEFNQEFQTLLATNGLSEEDLRGQFVLTGANYDYFLSYFRNSVKINKLADEVISEVTATDEEIETFYAENPEFFQTAERVTVRHILISNETADYETQAESVRQLIAEDASNFCDLVEEYTKDPASIPNCGEYTFSESDPFVPEFIEAGFDMDVNEIRLVESQFGIHIMIKDEVLPAGQQDLEDVREDLRSFLSQEEAQQTFTALVDQLRASADIK